jgi:hypothetical protein
MTDCEVIGGRLVAGTAEIANCRFEGSSGPVNVESGIVRDSRFVDNDGWITIREDGEFRGNTVSGGSQLLRMPGVVVDNTFSQLEGTAILVDGFETHVHNNTFFDIEGSAIHVRQNEQHESIATFERNAVVQVRSAPAVRWTVDALPYWAPVEFSESCNVFWENDQDSMGELDRTDLHVDPRFCDVASLDFRVPENSLLTEAANPYCGAIGGRGPGCSSTIHTITTFPGEFSVFVDGVELESVALVDWAPGSVHEISVLEDVEREDGRGYVFESWSDGGAATHTVVATDPPSTLFANVAPKFRLEMTHDGNGTVTPETAWYPESSIVTIEAIPTPPHELKQWIGEGEGSYTGEVALAVVRVRGPVTQYADFWREYLLDVVADPGGIVHPPSDLYYPGEHVRIQAESDEYHEFEAWIGEGPGSYTGPNPIRWITIQETSRKPRPTRQRPLSNSGWSPTRAAP